jgi:hypothetical protein
VAGVVGAPEAATCLNYAITASGDPWVSAVTNELASLAAKLSPPGSCQHGKTHHDAEQAKLEA